MLMAFLQCMTRAGEKLQTEECWAVQESDVQSWLSFTGQLHDHSQETVGILDLGGASTQITFLPRFEVSHLAAHLASISWYQESGAPFSHSSSATNRLSRGS